MGFDWDLFVSYAILVGLVVGTIVLIIMTCLRFHVDMIKNDTGKFLLELACIGIIPSCVCFIFIYTRNISTKAALEMTGLMAAHFIVLHLLFETSGYYENVFS